MNSSGPREIDPADARLAPINSYEDIADSGDEYWMKQDMIPLDSDNEPQAKRRKQWGKEDNKIDDSEEEVLGQDFSDDDIDNDDVVDSEALQRIEANLKRKLKTRTLDPEEEGYGDEDEENNDDDDEKGWLGASTGEFYDANIAETEEAAFAEQEEGEKIMRSRTFKFQDEDLFDPAVWQHEDLQAHQFNTIEQDEDIHLDAMTSEEKYQILVNRYPEFENLVEEFEELQPKLEYLRQIAEGKSSKSLDVIKYWTLGCYVAALASYFAILTSPARDDIGADRPLAPEELRDHEVMVTLAHCRQQWKKVKKLRLRPSKETANIQSPPLSPIELDIVPFKDSIRVMHNKPDESKASINVKNAKKVQEVQDSISDLSSLLKKSRPGKSKRTKFISSVAVDMNRDDLSDFGEEETMDAKYAAEKAARKKSLRFYTSQIVQKSNKRSGVTKGMGGDLDVPYRERLKDRQARLISEAQKRGSKAGPGAELDDNSSDDDGGKATKDIRDGADSDDGYYDMITEVAQKKKAEKKAKYEAYAAASNRDIVVEQEEIGEDGKRKISYAIEKNKGLTPHRKKINRNPRVKKKKAYAEKQKKWRTVRPTYQGMPKGGYQGELSGIKKGLVKVQRL